MVRNFRSPIVTCIIVFLLAFAYLLFRGNVYYLDIDANGAQDLADVVIELDEGGDEFIELSDIMLEDGRLSMKLKPLLAGHTSLSISTDEEILFYDRFYVHSSGIITRNKYLGDCTGGIAIPVAALIIVLILIADVYKRFRKDVGVCLYQYRNVMNLGIIVFLCGTLISQLKQIFSFTDIITVISGALSSAQLFATLSLPVVFVVSILVTISNVNLMIKEGKNWRNMLGTILGILFCLSTLTPILLSDLLQNTTIINTHDEQAAGMYLAQFVEGLFFDVTAYLECVLIGTIALSVAAAKHMPAFDKDYMLILGCQIREDGSLTNLLKGRVDKALEFAKKQRAATGKTLVFVPSGGKGGDEIMAEATALRNYLISHGIDEENILTDYRSANTFENMEFSIDVINGHSKTPDPKIAFATTNYHVFRSGLILFEQGVIAEGVGSRTKAYFWINAFVREFIATLYSERKTHIKIMLILILITALMVVAEYLSNTY